MATLTRAIQIATEAHDGQVDKGGAPYILHPLRVMLAMKTDEERIVAVLHDVMEDSKEFTPSRLFVAGYSDTVISALLALTKRHGETYEAFIGRVLENPLAKRVKAADMRDNMNLSRIPNPTEMDRARVMKYERYIHALEA